MIFFPVPIPCLKTFHSSVGSFLGKGLSYITPRSVITSLFSTSNNTPRISLQELNESNIHVIEALAKFRKSLEDYHPGIMQDDFTELQRDFKSGKGNAADLRKKHSRTLKNFEKIYAKVLQKELSSQKRNALEVSFKKFSAFFKTLVDSSPLDAQEIESIQLIKSEQLYNQLSQAIKYLESKKIDAQPLKDLQNEFNYNENKNNPTAYESTLKAFADLRKDILEMDFQDPQKVERENFFKGISLDPWQVAFNLLLEFNKTVIESHQLHIELDKVVAYIEKKYSSLENTKLLQDLRDQFDLRSANENSKQQTLPKVMRRQLLDSIADASAILELLISEKMLSNASISHKNTKKTILEELKKVTSLIEKDSSDNQEMRFYSTDNPIFETLKKKLQDLPKENPALFTKGQKRFLDSFQKELYAISHGKTFTKKDLQEKLYQCHNVIKETLPDTPFSETTDLLYDLEFRTKDKISIEDSKEIANGLTSLKSFTNNPRFFPPHKITIEELSSKFSSVNFDPATDLLESLADKHMLFFQPNDRAFKELKNTYSGTERPDGKIYPNFQKELDSLCPLKKIAFKKLKKIAPNRESLDLLTALINNPNISSEDKAKLENLDKKLSCIIPDEGLINLLDKLVYDETIPCRANVQTFESVIGEFFSAGIIDPPTDCLYPIAKREFESLQNKLSSIVPDQEIFDLLTSLINSPNIPPDEKERFKNLKENLSSMDKTVLDCLYPLERSVFEDLKNSLSSLRKEGLNFLNNHSTSTVDAERIKQLRNTLNSTPDQEAFECLDALINDPSIPEGEKQEFKSLKETLSLIRREFDCSDSIAQEELKEKLLAIIPDRKILRSLALVIKDSSVSEEQKKVFENLKGTLSSIDLEAKALLRSLEQSMRKENFSSATTRVINDLHSCISDPRIPSREKLLLANLKDSLVSIKQDMTTYLHSREKTAFEDLTEKLSSITPNQEISQEDSINLKTQFHNCRKIVEEIKTRTLPKERNRIAIEQELQKLAGHATTLSFMMLINKLLFTKDRDSLFYRTIIQKAEETSSCPKKLFLVELQNEGAPKWRIVAARACFFVFKHLGLERSVHKTISRVITKYSQLIYQQLDQEYCQDQLFSLTKTIIENTTTYFQLLSSAISNAKKDVKTQPDQLTELIVKQLLLLKPKENETTLQELDLKELYTKLVDDLIEKSESRLLKWIAYWLGDSKHTLISSIIETGIDSLLSPSPNGNASTINVLLRDELKTLYKKWPSIASENSSPTTSEKPLIFAPSEKLQLLTAEGKSKLLEIKKLVDLFVESFIGTLNEYSSIQQLASTVNTIAANERHIEYLKSQSTSLQGGTRPQIEELEKWNYEAKEKLNVLVNPVSNEEARPSFSLYPVAKDVFGEATHPWRLLRKDALSTTGDITRQHAIKPLANGKIEEMLTSALTKLFEQPSPEDLIYDLFYQILFLTNQSIEQPKENKEMQADVKHEIAELIKDNSFAISNSVAPLVTRAYTQSEQLSQFAKRLTSNWMPELISPVVEKPFQNIANLTEEKAFFQPEALLQLGKKIILPTAVA